jgi:23S rRNA (uracil1939-C5)-methyltransferase
VLLEIEKLVYGGDGLARSEGRVVLLPFVLPGEKIEAEVARAKNDLLRGRVVDIQTASERRVTPPCPYFYRCGGCHYQHADYEFQVAQKQSILREVLRRVGKIELDASIDVIASEPWGYRNRTQLHIENGAVGYYELGSHQLCPVDHCPISSPRLNEAIRELASGLPRLPRFTTELELFTNETEIQYLPSERVPSPARALLESIATTLPIAYQGFRVSRRSFFQVNRYVVDRLVEIATADASGGFALDLYAGVGLFSRTLADQFGRVTAVEAGASAIRDLQFNTPQVTPVHATTEQFLAELGDTPDFVLADPPRAGLTKAVVAALARLKPPRLHIVSCDPATLARDLQGLLAAGYRIDGITLVDLFPQTFHIETVAKLTMQ